MKEIYPELFRLMMRIARMRHRVSMDAVSGLGIHPSEHLLLMNLGRMGSAVSQTQIACEMEVTPASVARTVKSLDAGGYIERNESEGDSRRNEIRITEKGKAVTEESRRMFTALDDEICAGFSDGELMQLRDFFRRMLENISALERGKKDRGERDAT